MIPTAPNPPESPDSSREELAAVLREIAEIEGPDYMGPKINRDIKEARWIFGTAEEDLVVALGERGGGMTRKRSWSLEAIDEELAEIAERLKRPDTGVQWGWRK